MDLWALLLKYCFGTRSLDYGLFGRWIGHLIDGQFVHDNITNRLLFPVNVSSVGRSTI